MAARWSPWSSMKPLAALPMVPPAPTARLSSFPRPSKNSSFFGSPSSTVTILPPRPAFSSRSLTTTLGGIFSSSFEEHLHSFSGQPHVAQTRPEAVE